MRLGSGARRTTAALGAGLLVLGMSTVAQAAATITWEPRTMQAVFGNASVQASLALGSNDIWAVGQTGVSVGGAYEVRVVAMHYDGSTWTRANTPDRETAPANDYINGVAGTASDDVWLVGSSSRPAGQGGGRATLVEHWNGTNWQLLTSPNPAAGDSFNAASSPERGELWAVGDKADPNVGAYVPMVQRLVNGTWTEIAYSSPIPNCPTSRTALTSVLAVSSTDVYIGGDCVIRGHYRGIVAHWDGTQWTSAVVAATDTGFTGLGGGRGNDVWVVGQTTTAGSPNTTHGIAYHGSGTTWASVPMPNKTGYLRSIAGVGVGAGPTPGVYAVGRTYHGAGEYQGLIYRWNWRTSRWVSETINSTSTQLLYSAAVAPDDGSAWAVGFRFGPNGNIPTALQRTVN